MPFNKVKKGQPIRAAHMNRILSEIGGLKRLSGANGVGVVHSPGGASITVSDTLARGYEGVTVYAVNDHATQAFHPHDCVHVSSQDETEPAGRRGVVLTLDAFAAEADLDSFAICIDDILPGQMGRVLISGIALAHVAAQITDAFANPQTGSINVTGSTAGRLKVIWSDSDYALVQFPTGSGGGSTHWSFVWNED